MWLAICHLELSFEGKIYSSLIVSAISQSHILIVSYRMGQINARFCLDMEWDIENSALPGARIHEADFQMKIVMSRSEEDMTCSLYGWQWLCCISIFNLLPCELAVTKPQLSLPVGL